MDAAMTDLRPRLWVRGDWNAFFGFGTNILVNLLVLTGLLRFVLQMPDALVFGRILPATGLMLFLSTMYYAWLAYRLAKSSGRNDVCALPSGISVPHMFVVVFVIMLPILSRTKDPVQAWEAGLTWVFVQSFVLMAGGFVAPWIRRITPRAALLGSLAGISITFISMRPAAEVFLTPVIGVLCFAVILANWFGGARYFRGVPAGLVAIVVGTVIAWGSSAFGLDYAGMSFARVGAALSSFGFAVPDAVPVALPRGRSPGRRAMGTAGSRATAGQRCDLPIAAAWHGCHAPARRRGPGRTNACIDGNSAQPDRKVIGKQAKRPTNGRFWLAR